ncbi:MAG TPA: ATP-binding protein [Burkholderiaceae bacterium]|nr:ATP-binding protein [Burkholderiaceae bacterium]
MSSLRARVLLLVTAAGLLMAIVLSLAMHASVRSYYHDVIYRHASHFLDRLLDESPPLWHHYRIDADEFAVRLRQYEMFAPDATLYLLDPQGQVLAGSAAQTAGTAPRPVDLERVRRSLARDPTMPILGEDPHGLCGERACVVAARPLLADGREQAWLYLVARSSDLAMQMPQLVRSYAIQTAAKAGLLTLAIGVALMVAMIALLTRPLTALTAAAERVKETGFDGPGAPDVFPFSERNDEVGRLSRTFSQMLERLRLEMQRVRQTDAQRREMIASVSHDLRTPLTALLGQIETIRIKGDTLDDRQRQQFLDAALNNANHLKRLIDALAELAKLDSPEIELEREPIALGELADDLAQRYHLRAERAGLQLQVSYPDGLPLAQVDAALIERALANLLDNAIRVSPRGGRIEVRVERDGDRLRLEVLDSGPGVAPHEQERVFERFYQGSSHRELRGSSGLGLAIVRRVAELHGGRAGLRAAPGGGAAFYLLLPAR